MKTSFVLLSAFVLAITASTCQAAQSDCRKKYTGNLAVDKNQVGIGGKQNTLGQVGKNDYEAVNFAFWECNIPNYYRSPDEFGFLVADGTDPKSCATAVPGDANGATINHQPCDFDGKDKNKINQQLVYANYFRPNGGDAEIDIFFQGSALIATHSGFDAKHALLWPGQRKGSLIPGQVVINNQTSELNYTRLKLHDVSIAATDSLVSKKQTTNEGKIVKDVNEGKAVNFSNKPNSTPGNVNNLASTNAAPAVDKTKLFSN